MHDDSAHDHVVVSVEHGSEVQEELAVTVLGDGTYRLLSPPALAAGLATGDVFVVDEATLRPNVLRRSGNLTLWLYPATADHDVRPLTAAVEQSGGSFDGVAHDRVYIFTLPVAATFPVVEAIFDRYVAQHPGSQWYFGNVYADDGVTPLEWWVEDVRGGHG